MTASTPRHDAAVLHVGPALDYRRTAVFSTLAQRALREGRRYVILDFAGTGILDSSGLGAVVHLIRRTRALGGTLVFARVSPPVACVIKLTRLYRVVQQFLSVDDAVRACTQPTTAHAVA